MKPLLLLVEIARVTKRQCRLCLLKNVECELGRSLSLGMEVTCKWGCWVLCKGRTAFQQMLSCYREGGACC